MERLIPSSHHPYFIDESGSEMKPTRKDTASKEVELRQKQVHTEDQAI